MVRRAKSLFSLEVFFIVIRNLGLQKARVTCIKRTESILFLNRLRSPHVTESKAVLDSGSDSTLWIPDSRYWILICCHWNLDSRFHLLVGFRISQVKFSRIHDSIFKAKISRIPESRVPFMGRTLRRLACTQTLLYFSFRFRKLLLPPRLPPCAGGQQIPHRFYFLSRAQTNFEEKIEGL